MPRPTARGWALAATALVLWAGAVILQIDELLVVSAFLLALLIVTGVLVSIARPRDAVARQISPSAPRVGTSVSVALDTATATRRSWVDNEIFDLASADFEVTPVPHEQDIGPQMPKRSPNATTPQLPAQHYAAIPLRRGWAQVGPAYRVTHDVLGCWSRPTRVDAGTRVLVHPAIEPLGTIALVSDSGAADDEASAEAGASWVDLSVRPYVSGDPMSRIHWRTSARAGELMVRPDSNAESSRLVVLLDVRAGTYLPARRSDEQHPDDGEFEWAVGFAASLWESAVASATATTLILLGDAGLSISSTVAASRIALAEVRPGGSREPHLPDMSPEAATVAITGSHGAESIANATPVVRPQTIVAVVSDASGAGGSSWPRVAVDARRGALDAWNAIAGIARERHN